MSCGTSIRLQFSSKGPAISKAVKTNAVQVERLEGGKKGADSHRPDSKSLGRRGVRGWSFGRSKLQTLCQRAILCLSQPCSASGARRLASIATKGANHYCGQVMLVTMTVAA